jgi:2'-5' RNA ligase
MTVGAEQLRLFIAALAPPAVQAAVAAARGRPTFRSLPVRWIDPAGAHITLQFLGATDPARLPGLTAALARVAAGGQPLRLRTAGLGVFPSPARARVVWLGLAGDVARLAALQAAVVAATGPLGFAADARPFAPHLTIGRARDSATPAERAMIGDAAMAATAPAAVAWPVEELALMSSTLGRSGAVYRAVGRWRLGSGSLVNE